MYPAHLQGLRATPGLIDPQVPVLADSGQMLSVGTPSQAKYLEAGADRCERQLCAYGWVPAHTRPTWSRWPCSFSRSAPA